MAAVLVDFVSSIIVSSSGRSCCCVVVSSVFFGTKAGWRHGRDHYFDLSTEIWDSLVISRGAACFIEFSARLM